MGPGDWKVQGAATFPEVAVNELDSRDLSQRDRAEKLVRDNLGWLMGWVRGRVSDPETAHDICQDALVKALRSLGELKDPARFPAWLYRIAANTLRDHLRRKKRWRRWFLLSDKLDDFEGESGPKESAVSMEESEKVLRMVGELPPRYREPLLLRHSQDLSYAEIGRILKISENAVQVRIFRARKMLREKIAGDEDGM